ncbi:SRPBCC family protein [Cellvibrio sp. KY-YJ-3]|uniref:SRPBCC family protein n=1 Tax=Cellvibrio sp. KY-YJ-3 TaxID=454662 RepID=UPI001244A1AC|nr:SRPBCC family protein [Cellvibrio sp. KY-YJ-3]QEY11571.1 ATPase [Cellvibrio sp. KY-YJ-3]
MNDYGVLTAPDTLRIERLLPGPIERVWQYLTDSDKRATWLAAGNVEQQIGGKVEHTFRNSELSPEHDIPPPKYSSCAGDVAMLGKVTACEPLRLLSYIWNAGSEVESEVSFELAPEQDQVKLTVTHRRLTNPDERLSVAGGWHTHLNILRDVLNGKIPPGFWKVHTQLEQEYAARLAG